MIIYEPLYVVGYCTFAYHLDDGFSPKLNAFKGTFISKLWFFFAMIGFGDWYCVVYHCANYHCSFFSIMDIDLL